MALLYKRRVMAFKVETVAGTAEALTNTEACFCLDPVLNYDVPMSDRVATGSLSKLVSVPGARSAKASFSVELTGGGSAVPPSWAALLTACGMHATSNVYTFSSVFTNEKTLTIGLYEDGRFKKMAGAMGTFSIDAQSGKPASVKFDFEGIWAAPTDVAMLALPSYSIVPPRFAAATFTVGGFTPKISKFSLNAGNKIKLVEDVTTVSAYSRAVITDRDVKGKIDPKAELVATWDAYGLWVAGTTGALSCVIGSVTDNTITIAAPYVQFQDVKGANSDGVLAEDIDFLCAASSSGDDEFSITWS